MASKNQPCFCGKEFVTDSPHPVHHTQRTCSKCGNQWIMSQAEILDPKNTLFEDPFKTIPLGWRCPKGQYTVAGFCSMKTLLGLMVNIRYDGEPPTVLSSTTRDYLGVVQDYKDWTDHLPLKERLLALGHSKEMVALACPE